MLCASLQLNAGVVALTLLAEARGEGRDGLGAVAAVISQRAINRSLTAREVCLQPYQFSCWNGKTEQDLQHLYRSPMAAFAFYLEENIDRIDRSKINYADHYYADYIKAPYWAKGRKPVARIGRHIFYLLWKKKQ
jgi:spore germination cell wall hydrolase CwlJ-like protein